MAGTDGQRASYAKVGILLPPLAPHSDGPALLLMTDPDHGHRDLPLLPLASVWVGGCRGGGGGYVGSALAASCAS